MKYINKRTQAVIETACTISGGDWILVKEQPNTDPKVPVKKANRKKSGEKS